MKRTALLAIFAGIALAGPALAEGFERVTDEARFLALVENRDLTRLGVSVKVERDGDIIGRAFGRQVTGEWQWADGFFCRDLYYGSDNLGANCQMVEVSGRTLRFTSDRGAGIHADLRVR